MSEIVYSVISLFTHVENTKVVVYNKTLQLIKHKIVFVGMWLNNGHLQNTS